MYAEFNGGSYWNEVDKELAKMREAAAAIDPETNAEPTEDKRKKRINK